MSALFDVFDRPWLLPLVVVLPALVAFCLAAGHRRRVARLARLGGAEMVARLVPSLTVRRPVRRSLLLGLAAALAAVAAAGPRWGAEPTMVRGSGIDVVLLLDASLSMLAEDERPSRMERMKQEVRRFRALSEGDRIALLAFAGRSYILSPLTVDDGALDLFLDNFDPTVVGQPGSSMSRAITQAVSLLQNTPTESDRAIVLMSDGEAFEPVETIAEAARQARDAHIAFVTVGFGTAQGGTIPERTGNTVVQHRDESGQVVTTHYDAQTMRAAAEAAGGTFVDAAESDKAGRVKRALSTLRAQTRATAAGRDRKPRYQFFLFPALLILLGDTLVAERRGRSRRHDAAASTTATEAAEEGKTAA